MYNDRDSHRARSARTTLFTVIRYHPVESVPSPRTPRIESTDAYPQQIMNRTTPASTCCSKVGSTPRAGWTLGKQTQGVLNAPACCNRHGAPPRAVRVHIPSRLEYVNVARPGRTGHRTPPYVRRDARRDCSHQAGREARKALTGRGREDFARAFHPAAEDGVCPCAVQLTRRGTPSQGPSRIAGAINKDCQGLAGVVSRGQLRSTHLQSRWPETGGASAPC